MKPSSILDRSPRSILCPVDFSAQSRLALHAAARIADRFHANITVVFAEDPLLSRAASVRFDARALAKATEADLGRFVRRAIGRDDGNRAIAYRVVSGQPATEIGKAARSASADLIVMGTQGLSGPKKLVVGSTTEAVLHDTRVPVLAVPPGALRQVRARRWLRKKAVAAVELDTHASSDARAAARAARIFGASLLLVHVVRPVLGPPWLRAHLRNRDRARLADARDRMRALKDSVKKVKVQARLLLGDPAEEIVAVASDLEAGLVILLLRRGRGLFGPRKGSIAYRVLCGAATPLLAVPAIR